MEADYILQMKNIGKSYYDNPILKNVSLNVKKGEIHALLGENGAGKSTLMNVLFGMEVIHSTGGYTGDIVINGEQVYIDTPQKAMDLGIGMVHQEFMQIPGFSVTENIKLGREISTPTISSKIFGKKLEKLDMDKMRVDARVAMDKVGLTVDEDTIVGGMPVGYRQFIEIAREIDKSGINLLVFDEPTAVLTESEAEKLMDTMQSIAKNGIAIIFITHRLKEVMKICDSITVLRDGELIKTMKTNDTNEISIASLMVGRDLDSDARLTTKSNKTDEIALKLKNFSVDMDGEEVKDLDLTVYKGEILGIGGLAGQGKLGICNGIMGIKPAEGEAEVFGEKLNLSELGAALKKKIAFVSEDRRGVGLLLDDSIADNIVFNAMQINKDFLFDLKIFTIINPWAVNAHANDMIKELDIRCTGSNQPVGRLSGGNQQKVCLAKALALNPKLLLVAEPTRGIDIGAKNIVLEKLVKLNEELGMTIIMVSSELAELRSICDRIAIITDGKVASIMEPDASNAAFGLAMSGSSVEGGETLEY